VHLRRDRGAGRAAEGLAQGETGAVAAVAVPGPTDFDEARAEAASVGPDVTDARRT